MESKRKRRVRIVALLCSLACLVSAGTFAVFAGTAIELVGEMKTDIDGRAGIKDAFSSYLVQDTVRSSDSYVGDYQYTVYYDNSKGKITTGYEGTPVIVYAVNTNTERVGTDTNKTIITSMLKKGYVVVVLDYLCSAKATGEMLDLSTQNFRVLLRTQKILKNTAYFPSGNIDENFLAPSGCNVLLNQVFWEIDKHSTSGTLEKIVENWNSDFRATNGEKAVYWLHSDNTPKATQTAFDKTSPVWYTDSLAKTEANGQDSNGDGIPDDAKYTKIKWTKAESITDCVDPDGSFIDMNLYINVVYPTNPKNEVPVFALANSSGYPTTSVTSEDLRPHSNGALFRGYANVVFDYLWVPMARSASWGYYDGSGGVTKDHMNYAVMMYNDKLVNTAAMRYLRQLSANGGTNYRFDEDAFGVYGNSKGGWFSFLGEAVLQGNLAKGTYATDEAKEAAIDEALAAFTPDRYYNGPYHGETRYQAKEGVITGDGITVKAGTLQPWLLYADGSEIPSGAQFTNACNGSQEEDITAGHSPIFISGNMTDTYNAAYSYSVGIYNICRELDIPLLHFEVPIGHTLTSGQDMNYNVNTYDAYFNYVNYYLKKGAISVAYMTPMNNAGGVKTTDKITFGFAGAATLDAVKTITFTAGSDTLTGTWESSFGGTVWTFIPNNMKGSTEYTVTVPASFAGDNGVEMGTAYTSSFITETDNATEVVKSESNGGIYYTFTAPAMTNGNSFVLRFLVTNDAANVAELYTAATAGAEKGTLLGSVNLRGKGSYEIDITDYVAAKPGEELTVFLKTAKAVADKTVFENTLTTQTPTAAAGIVTKAPAIKNYITSSYESIKGRVALKTAVTGYVLASGGTSSYQLNTTEVFSVQSITGGEKTTSDNLGRKYTIYVDIYDTVSRTVQFKLNSMTNRTGYGTIDYNNVFFAVTTTAGKWETHKIEYTVYEADYGKVSLDNTQSLAVFIAPDGDTASSIYFSNIKTVEHITDMAVGSAVVAEKNDGTGDYKAPTSTEKPIALYNGDTLFGEYASWKQAMNAYKTGYTLKLRADYSFTDSDVTDAIGKFSVVNIDLNGYTISLKNTKNSLLWAKASASLTEKTVVNFKNGAALLGRTPLISYEDSIKIDGGKRFDINLSNVYVGLLDRASATEMISADVATDGAIVSSNISLTDCAIDFDQDKHARDAMTVFAGSKTSTLVIGYKVTGGEIKLSSQRWVTISDNARIVDFVDGSSGYTYLIMPESITAPVTGSYLIEDGYAGYVKESASGGYTTYVLEKPANSTRYGVITSGYENYTFLVFKDGNLISGHNKMKEAVSAASALLDGADKLNSQAEILLRKNYTNTDDEATFGLNNGTLVFDMGGFTITRANPMFTFYIGDTNNVSWESKTVIKNGTALTPSSVIGVTHRLGTSEASFTSGKVHNVTFENVTFGYTSTSTATSGTFLWTVWNNDNNNTHPDFYATTNITFSGCTFDLSHEKLTSVTAMDISENHHDINVRINGGTIKCGNATPTLIKSGSGDSVIFGTDAEGKYTSLTSSGSKYVSQSFLCDDGKYRCYEPSSSGYNFVVNDLVTKYGEIPSDKKSVEDYPFVVFDENRNFLGAYAGFYASDTIQYNDGAIGKAKTHMKDNVWNPETKSYGSNPKAAYVLMRRNYELGVNEKFDNLAQFQGTVTIDLGGYELSQPNTGKYLFNATIKGWPDNGEYNSSNPETAVFSKTIRVINGKIETYNTSPVVFNTTNDAATGTHLYKTNFDFEFEGIDFYYTANTGTVKASALVIDSTGTAKYAANANVKFTNCSFDVTNAPSEAILFNASHSNITQNITVAGCTVKADDWSGITFSNIVTGKLVLEKLNGEYLKLKYPAAKAPVTDTVGGMYFVETDDDGETSTYCLRSFETSLGTVPHETVLAHPEYLSALDYPFFVFSEGEFVGAEGLWLEAMRAVKDEIYGASAIGKTAGFAVRRDYVTTSSDSGMWDFCSYIGGNAIIDLGGFTVTRDMAYLIDMSAKATNGVLHDTSITMRNGTVRSDRYFIGLNYNASAVKTNSDGSVTVKNVDIILDNVTVAPTPSASNKTILLAAWDSTAKLNQGLTANVTLRDCTFDFTDANLTKKTGVGLFQASDSRGDIDVCIVFEGGKVICGNYSDIVLFDTNTGDSVKFGKGSDGKYMTLVQSVDAEAPTVSYTATNGKMLSFSLPEVSIDGAVSMLGEPIKTSYGDIPFRYENEKLYPFAVFTNNEFKGAYGAWADQADQTHLDALQAAKDLMHGAYQSGVTVQILLRRDYYGTDTDAYNNLSQIGGTLVLDLNGKNFFGGSKTIFAATGKLTNGVVHDTKIKVINGNISTQNSIVAMNHTSALTEELKKTFYFTFENVKFGIRSGSTSAAPIIRSDVGGGYAVYLNAVFNNCTFDFVTVAPTVDINVFQLLNTGGDGANASVTVNGGEIKLDKFKADGGKVNLVQMGEGDRLLFGKLNGGSYTKFTLGSISDSVKNSMRFATEKDGEAALAGSDSSYRVTPLAVLTFVPENSITLDAELIYNIYIPKNALLESFTVDDKTYNVSDGLKTVTRNSKEYYLVEVPLASSEAARAVPFAATLKLASGNMTGRWSLNIPQYAERVLALDTISADEKQLMRDVLSYIKAAYVYFTEKNTASEIDRVVGIVDKIIGENYDATNAPDLTATPVKPDESTGFIEATMQLGATPAFVFKMADGTDISKYSFVNSEGDPLEVTTDGSYVFVTMYAYGMGDTVSFTGINADGESVSGSYNVEAYYAWVTEDGNTDSSEALVTLVERFAKYCESAAAYRASKSIKD